MFVFSWLQNDGASSAGAVAADDAAVADADAAVADEEVMRSGDES